MVLALLTAVALATVMGLVALWPADVEPDEGVAAQFAAPGVTFPRAEVVEVRDSCDADVFAEAAAAPPPCAVLEVQLRSGPEQGDTVQVEVIGPTAEAGLRPGDVVRWAASRALEDVAELDGARAQAQFSFFGVDRTTPLALMAGLFVLVVLLVARWRGLLALVGLVFAGWVVFQFLLPALLAGEPALGVALVAASVIMYVVLYLVHGVFDAHEHGPGGHDRGHRASPRVLAEVAVGGHPAQRGRRRGGWGAAVRDPARAWTSSSAADLCGRDRRAGRPQRRHHHPGVGGVGAAGGRT